MGIILFGTNKMKLGQIDRRLAAIIVEGNGADDKKLNKLLAEKNDLETKKAEIEVEISKETSLNPHSANYNPTEGKR